MLHRCPLFLALVIGLAACAPPASPPAQRIPTITPQQEIMPPTALNSLVEQAKQDLARRLSISDSQISLKSAEAVTWPDSSLGCPEDGMMYSQVLTPGFLIVLDYEGTSYEYHAGKGPEAFLCLNPSPPVQGMPDDT